MPHILYVTLVRSSPALTLSVNQDMPARAKKRPKAAAKLPENPESEGMKLGNYNADIPFH